MVQNNTKWVQAMADCLSAFLREQAGTPYPVVDYEVRPAAAGSPDDMRIWLICRTTAEKDGFVATERSRSISVFRKKMIAAGFPDSAVASAEIKITSRDEVEKAGGSTFFLR